MSKILFEVEEEHLETGMRGFPVGYCTTSSVDPKKGLFYVGHPLAEMKDKSPEEMIYLLYHQKLGSEGEIDAFSKNLQARSKCSEETLKHIRQLPKQGHPMALFSSAILIAGMLEGTNDYREDCLNLIAKVPQIAAYVINYHAGWEPCNPSKPELGYMENFTQMLNVPNANSNELTRVFRLFNILHYDHGGGNLSAFVGKVVASGLQDLYGSIASAMCALGGPRHGKANQDCLDFVRGIIDEIGENATVEDVKSLIIRRLEGGQLLYGFGHAVLRVEDPRATIFYDVAQKDFPDHPLVKMTKLLREAGPEVLGANPKIANPYPNVDAISGTVLSVAGFPYPEYYTVLFGIARVVGISIQIVYERLEARGGRGTPIIRPKYFYKGL